MTGERERDAGDRRGEPCDRRTTVCEVGVDVGDVAGGVDPVGQLAGVQQLLHVDAARTPPLAGADRLRGRGGQCAGETSRVPACRVQQRCAECRHVAGEPTREPGRRQRCGVGEVGRHRVDAVDDRVVRGFLRALEHKELQRDAELLEPPDLAGDEELRDPRVALEQIGDGADAGILDVAGGHDRVPPAVTGANAPARSSQNRWLQSPSSNRCSAV